MSDITDFSRKAISEASDPSIQTDTAYEAKLAAVRRCLDRLYQKFPRTIDSLIFKELDRLTACLETDFIRRREMRHLSRLAYSIYFVRKLLLSRVSLFPTKERHDVRLFPTCLHFTFGSKQVVGVLAHVYLKNKYEVFDEEQILLLARKVIPDIQLIQGSLYESQPPKSTIRTLYFEICKACGTPLTLEEVQHLREFLQRNIKFTVERLVPRIFKIRNEEETFRNILILSQEIKTASDLPQVMILFDEQTPQEVVFTVILVKARQAGTLPVQDYFNQKMAGIEYMQSRSNVVRYLGKDDPIESHVFDVKVAKNVAFLRTDLSLNFYQARQKVSEALTELVGPFRDYNGGVLIKQGEALASFKKAFPDLVSKSLDLLENFYYSLSPVEVQAVLPPKQIKTLFELFLEGLEADLSKPSDYFLKYVQDDKLLFIMVRVDDESFKYKMEAMLSLAGGQRIATSILHLQTTYCLGYLIEANSSIQKHISDAVLCALKERAHKLDKRQILRLTMSLQVVSLDPRMGGDQMSSIVLKMLFEGLMRMNRNGELENGLAEKVEISADRRSYIFKLRPALWSDKTPVSAFDFEYTWKKILSPSFKTIFAYLFYPIKNAKLAKSGVVPTDAVGVKALDDSTLQVELEFPASYFLELTSLSMYSPVNRAVDQQHPHWSLEAQNRYVCNGAFQLAKNESNRGYELIKNPLYWDCANIKLDEIIISHANRYQAYEMFQKNMSHWIGAPLGTWDPSFTATADDKRESSDRNNVYWYIFNTQRFPFNNKKIRQALAMVVDRSVLASDQFSPVFSPLPPPYSQVDASSSPKCNASAALALFEEGLEEMYLSRRDFPVISLTYLAVGTIVSKTAELIKHQWETALNIRCTLDPVPWSVLLSNMTKGNFQVAGVIWESWIKDPIYTLGPFRNASDPMNMSRWENSRYQYILDQADGEMDAVKRRDYYSQAEQILLDEAPVLALYSCPLEVLKKKNFHMRFSSLLPDFRWAYFKDL